MHQTGLTTTADQPKSTTIRRPGLRSASYVDQ